MDLDPREVVECGKVGPGEVLVVDTRRGEVIRNLDAKREVAGRRPYARWVARYMATLVPDPARVPPVHAGEALTRAPAELRLWLRGSASRARADGRHRRRSGVEHGRRHAHSAALGGAAEPVRLLPPAVRAGDQPADRLAARGDGDVAPDAPGPARLAAARAAELRAHAAAGAPGAAARGDGRAPERGGLLDRHPRRGVGHRPAVSTGSRPALTALRRAAERAARRGAHILIISDRAANETHAPIPMLLAIGAVRQHLVHTGLRARVGLVAEAGDAFDIHHFATLIGYGAEAVHPWLALETLDGLFGEAREPSRREREAEARAAADARPRRRAAVPLGRRRRACSRSCRRWASRRSARTAARRSSRCSAWATRSSAPASTGTASPIGGIGFEEIAEDVLARHRAAFPSEADAEPVSLPDHGRVRFRKEGEDHGWAPPVVVALQQAVKANGAGRLRRVPGQEREPPAGRSARPAGGPPGHAGAARGGRAGRSRSARRFVSSAMSLGALSPEAHATLSIAMNRMGARSNSGEGGEDPHNYHGFANGDRADNRIKQVASARFGVTTEYLTRAEELEIKIVQGAKPGEGGQLPAHKVTDLIARLRHSVPGVSLISPPPHHDIYSIEDLAQLIHDLKTVNPRARVGREARVRDRRRHGGGRRGQGVRRLRADRRAQRRHRRLTALLHQARGLPVGAGARRGAGHAGPERASPPDRGAHRRRAQDRPRRRHRGAARRRDLRLRHGAAGGDGLRHGPAVPHQHLSRPASRPSARTCAPSSRARPSRSSPTSRCWPRRCGRSSPAWAFAAWTRSSAGTTCSSGSSGPTCRGRRCSICRCCWRPALHEASAGRPMPLRRTEARNDRPGVVSLDARNPRRPRAVSRERAAFLGQLSDPQPPPGGRRAGGRRDRRAARRRRARPRAQCGSGSPGARDRASAPSPAGGCTSSSRARPTTTWARG